MIHYTVTDTHEISPWLVQCLILKAEHAVPHLNSIMGYNFMCGITYHCCGGGSCLSLLRLSWRWRQFLLKCWQLYTNTQGVIFIKTCILYDKYMPPPIKFCQQLIEMCDDEIMRCSTSQGGCSFNTVEETPILMIALDGPVYQGQMHTQHVWRNWFWKTNE